MKKVLAIVKGADRKLLGQTYYSISYSKALNVLYVRNHIYKGTADDMFRKQDGNYFETYAEAFVECTKRRVDVVLPYSCEDAARAAKNAGNLMNRSSMSKDKRMDDACEIILKSRKDAACIGVPCSMSGTVFCGI